MCELRCGPVFGSGITFVCAVQRRHVPGKYRRHGVRELCCRPKRRCIGCQFMHKLRGRHGSEHSGIIELLYVRCWPVLSSRRIGMRAVHCRYVPRRCGLVIVLFVCVGHVLLGRSVVVRELLCRVVPTVCWRNELFFVFGRGLFVCGLVGMHKLRRRKLSGGGVSVSLHQLWCRVLFDRHRAVVIVGMLELRGWDNVGCRRQLLQCVRRWPVPKLRGGERVCELRFGPVFGGRVNCMRAVQLGHVPGEYRRNGVRKLRHRQILEYVESERMHNLHGWYGSEHGRIFELRALQHRSVLRGGCIVMRDVRSRNISRHCWLIIVLVVLVRHVRRGRSVSVHELRCWYIPGDSRGHELFTMLGGHVLGCRGVSVCKLRRGNLSGSVNGDSLHQLRCRVLLDSDRAVFLVNMLELRGGDSIGFRRHLVHLVCRRPVPKLGGGEYLCELRCGPVFGSGITFVCAVQRRHVPGKYRRHGVRELCCRPIRRCVGCQFMHKLRGRHGSEHSGIIELLYVRCWPVLSSRRIGMRAVQCRNVPRHCGLVIVLVVCVGHVHRCWSIDMLGLRCGYIPGIFWGRQL